MEVARTPRVPRSLSKERKEAIDLAQMVYGVLSAYRDLVVSGRDGLEKEINQLRGRLVNLNMQWQLVQHVGATAPQLQYRLMRSFKDVAKLYDRIDIESDKAVAYVDNVRVLDRDSGDMVDLGPHKVEVFWTGEIRMFVLPGGRIHPHLTVDGHPCWGEELTRALTNVPWWDFGRKLSLAKLFLDNYYPNGAYYRLSNSEEDRCRNCDDSGSPWCIFECNQNGDNGYTCPDDCTVEREYCYNDCVHNDGNYIACEESECEFATGGIPTEREECWKCPYFDRMKGFVGSNALVTEGEEDEQEESEAGQEEEQKQG